MGSRQGCRHGTRQELSDTGDHPASKRNSAPTGVPVVLEGSDSQLDGTHAHRLELRGERRRGRCEKSLGICGWIESMRRNRSGGLEARLAGCGSGDEVGDACSGLLLQCSVRLMLAHTAQHLVERLGALRLRL